MGPWKHAFFQVDIHVWLHAVPNLALDKFVWCLWKALGYSGQGPYWPSHHVHLYQAAEQGACDQGPLQGQVQVSWPPEDPQLQEAGFTKFNVNEFENMMAEMQFISDGSGAK